MSSYYFEYNINGIGNISTVCYGLSSELFNDKNLNIEKKLKTINQLGAIKYLHNGAHYTRFEYLILQIKILNIVKETNKTLGLSSKAKEIGVNTEITKTRYLTRAELIIFTFLCTNIGHFTDTFSSNKVWFNLLRNNLTFKKYYFSFFEQDEKELIDKMLNLGIYHKLHWFNTLLILDHYKLPSYFRQIWKEIIIILMNNDSNLIKDVYEKVRKVSYIVLDSNFSFTPLKVSLSDIIINIDYFVDEFTNYNSELFAIYDRMNLLLEESLYMDNNAVLMASYRSKILEKEIIQDISKKRYGKKLIKYFLFDYTKSPLFKELEFHEADIPWNRKKNLSITIPIEENEENIIDVYEFEKNLSKKLSSNIFLGINKNPEQNKLRIVFSISERDKHNKSFYKDVYKVLKTSINSLMDLKQNYSNALNEKILKKHIIYFFRNILNEDFYCDFNNMKLSNSFVIHRGKKTTLLKIAEIIKEFRENNPNDDALHELKTIYRAIESMDHKGVYLVYLGSLRFIDKQRKSKCEVDGLIITYNSNKILLHVIEAKNISRAQIYKVSKKQLNDNFIPILNKNLMEDIDFSEVENFGAMAKLCIM